MLVEKQPNVLIKQAQNQPKKLQTSPNYSPKFVIKLTVCSESNHHYLIAVAVFVQHTAQLTFLTKQPQTYHIITSSNIITTLKLLLIIPHMTLQLK